MADQKPEKDGFSGQTPKAIADFDPPRKPKRNKFALACSILASMTSVLLGYGTKYFSFISSIDYDHIYLLEVY